MRVDQINEIDRISIDGIGAVKNTIPSGKLTATIGLPTAQPVQPQHTDNTYNNDSLKI